MLNNTQYNLFYNTISEKNPELAQYKAQAATQEERVLAYLQYHKRSTTSRIARDLDMNLNSARRSVTNLYKKGKLIKTKEKVVEEFSKPNFIYQIVWNTTFLTTILRTT